MLARLEQAAAVGERPLDADPAKRRALPQVADTYHRTDRFGQAIQLETEPLPLADTAAREATTHRLIRRRRFGQSHGSGAAAEIETGIRVRARAGAARILSVSSGMAAHRARERVGR